VLFDMGIAMAWLRRNRAAEEANEVITQANRQRRGVFPTLVSVIALAISGYTLWENSLKQANLQVFVPPVVQYSSPYQNSNFEVLAIPLTIANEGAQTGTVLNIDLEVTNPKTQATKHFYSADFGRWSMEKTRGNAYQPFAPISLEGHGRRTETVLFYTRSDQEKPDQIIREPGSYQFRMTLAEDRPEVPGWLDRVMQYLHPGPTSVGFERELRFYDARVFNNGTLPLYSVSWRTPTRAAASDR
jgi:hypothetical protein